MQCDGFVKSISTMRVAFEKGMYLIEQGNTLEGERMLWSVRTKEGSVIADTC